ncbi:sugar transferase [Weissella cibaria]|uniref:sugar transferase n=1 Tax=Weissella cibaria TaxID=137591 RepID=UPI00223B60F2|nr:sugar transferase [Weissella cibaria]MCT0021402.1 sugar transferase [Weissella cibaria]
MYERIWKRAFDILGAVFLLVLACVPMLMVAVLIKIESVGPIFFKQLRVGRYSKPFYLYKFRSMRIDTPEVSSNHLNGHKYVTFIGRIMRKTSVDELPQLFNVLKGEMSFIGPRPVIVSENEVVSERRNRRADRCLPGISGWAQVNGRDRVTAFQKVVYDAEYALDINFRRDLKILFLTIWNVLFARGVVEEKIQ